MENQQAPNPTGKKESSIDPVKAQGVMVALSRKEKNTARQWKQRWSFYSRIREIQEEEAEKLGMSKKEYRDAVKSLNCQPIPKEYPVQVDPSPHPIPITSSAMIGRRAQCPLERYGRLVRSSCDYPQRPPLPPGQLYDPYKQTIIFLGIDVGDPISYKLPPATCEVGDEEWAEPRQLTVTPINERVIDKLLHHDAHQPAGHRQAASGVTRSGRSRAKSSSRETTRRS